MRLRLALRTRNLPDTQVYSAAAPRRPGAFLQQRSIISYGKSTEVDH